MAVSYSSKKCESCGGSLEYIRAEKLWRCRYCGTEVIREETYDGLFTIKNVVRQTIVDAAYRRLDGARDNITECQKIDVNYVGTIIARLCYRLVCLITPGSCREEEVGGMYQRLKDDYGVLCTGEILAAGNRAEACRTDKTAGASRSDGRKLRGRNSGTRLLCGVDLRDHDRACADIQSLIDPDIAAARYADDRANAGDVCCTDQIGEFLEGGGAVLHIQQDKVVSRMAGRLHKRRVSTNHEGTQRTLVGVHCGLESGHAVHSRHFTLHRNHLLFYKFKFVPQAGLFGYSNSIRLSELSIFTIHTDSRICQQKKRRNSNSVNFPKKALAFCPFCPTALRLVKRSRVCYDEA